MANSSLGILLFMKLSETQNICGRVVRRSQLVRRPLMLVKRATKLFWAGPGIGGISPHMSESRVRRIRSIITIPKL